MVGDTITTTTTVNDELTYMKTSNATLLLKTEVLVAGRLDNTTQMIQDSNPLVGRALLSLRLSFISRDPNFFTCAQIILALFSSSRLVAYRESVYANYLPVN